MPIGGYLCFIGFLEDFLRMPFGVKTESLVNLYGRFYCEEAIKCSQNKDLKKSLTKQEMERLFEQNEALRRILFDALMRIEASYSALLIRLMDDYAKKHTQEYANPDLWYEHSAFSNIRFEYLQKDIKAYKLIALQSFGTLVAIHKHPKLPKSVQNSIVDEEKGGIGLDKHYLECDAARLFKSFVGLRNYVTHNRWLIRETYQHKPLGYNPHAHQSQLGLYVEWIQHVLNRFDPSSAVRFETSISALKKSLPDAVVMLYF